MFATTLRHIQSSATTSYFFPISADLLPLSSLQLSNACQSGSLPSLASAATSILFKSSKSFDCSNLYSMADIQKENMQPSSMSLPPPPQFTGAPGQQQYENGTTNGQGNPAHMPPPPLPPVVIPQNTNPIPTAMTSPGGDSTGMLSPSSGSGGFVRRAAPEPNKRALYVGGLDPRVTEDILRQIFETTGHVQNVKIIPDKNMGAVSRNTSKCAASLEFPCTVVLGIKLANRKTKNALLNVHFMHLHTHISVSRRQRYQTLSSLHLLIPTRVRVSTTASLNTTTQLQQNAPCRLSTVVASTKR